jgi:hypothetical protein
MAREGKLIDTGHKTLIFATYTQAIDVGDTY